jgi:ParB family chromosome partitioning protein
MTQLDLVYETVDLDTLKPYPGNARRGNLDTIKQSLEINGQYRPLVVQASTRHILAGNHTYFAMRELGWSTAKISLIDCDDQAGLKINLVDNKSNDDATYDPFALQQLLAEADELIGTGWTQAEVDKLAAAGADVIEEPDSAEQMGGLEFRVIVDAESEEHQAELIATFEAEGLSCRPLVS